MKFDNLYDELTAKIEKLEAMRRELRDDTFEVETLAVVHERVKNKVKKPKFMTGIPFFDRRMGGFTHGTFVNIAGANFTGKTEFVLTILSNISKHRPVLFFSFEMYEDRVDERTATFTDEQRHNFYMEQKRNNLDEIEGIIRQYAGRGVDFVAIDSRMKINVSGNKEEYQKNSEISRRMSKLTQELGIVILMINQISESDLRTGRPSLKGSGDQSYDSDVILYVLPVKDDDNKRLMVCEKDRINQRKWKEEYTLNELRGSLGYTEVVYGEMPHTA